MLDQSEKPETGGESAPPAPEPVTRRGWGLTARLLAFTILFVMLSEALISVPSIANFRVSWLSDRLQMADAASSVLIHSGAVEITQEVQDELLDAVGATAIAVRDETVSRLISRSATPPIADSVADLRAMDPAGEVADAFATLFAASPSTIRVIGETQSGALIEMLMSDEALQTALRSYTANVLWLSALLSAITAVVLFLAINLLLVRPMRRLAGNMIAFSEMPEDPERVIVPSGRRDEIGRAEERLARMQTTLQETLRQQRRLADLGLAVSKINHDLRNMLASAQLFSDRLGSLPDPTVQKFAPKLIGALDRAIAYCQNTLAYGGAREEPPVRRLVALHTLVDDVAEVLGLTEHATITWENAVPDDLEIDADPDQLFRVLVNLSRNAVQALEGDDGEAVVRRLSISAERDNSAVSIWVRDTGPGVPARARENLFQAFHGSVRPGGTGLGLAIAAELTAAHGGTIDLVEIDAPGATFRIVIPDRSDASPPIAPTTTPPAGDGKAAASA